MAVSTKSAPWIISAALAGLLALSWYDTNQKLLQKDTEISNLKQRYSQLVIDANKKLADANTKVTQIAEEANAKIRLANLPEIPVRVSFRKALLGSGNVAAFQNSASETVAVTANIERPSTGQSRIFNLTIDPHLTKEIGELEGWAFISGDTVTLTQGNHKSLHIQAP